MTQIETGHVGSFVRDWVNDPRYGAEQVQQEANEVVLAFAELLVTGKEPDVDAWTANQQVFWDFLVNASRDYWA